MSEKKIYLEFHVCGGRTHEKLSHADLLRKQVEDFLREKVMPALVLGKSVEIIGFDEICERAVNAARNHNL